MVETQEFGGKIFRRYPNAARSADRSYFRRSITGGTVLLHREVWRHHHGDIPKGWHIHHKDGNPANNDISNLEAVPVREHLGGHGPHAWSDERKARQAEHLERIRHLTKAWRSSEQGREVHRRIGGLAYKAHIPQPKNCQHCGSVFLTRKQGHRDKFCSNACKSAYRRASGVDDEQRTCHCGSSFTVNRYSKARSCSRSCAQSLRRGRS